MAATKALGHPIVVVAATRNFSPGARAAEEGIDHRNQQQQRRRTGQLATQARLVPRGFHPCFIRQGQRLEFGDLPAEAGTWECARLARGAAMGRLRGPAWGLQGHVTRERQIRYVPVPRVEAKNNSVPSALSCGSRSSTLELSAVRRWGVENGLLVLARVAR